MEDKEYDCLEDFLKDQKDVKKKSNFFYYLTYNNVKCAGLVTKGLFNMITIRPLNSNDTINEVAGNFKIYPFKK